MQYISPSFDVIRVRSWLGLYVLIGNTFSTNMFDYIFFFKFLLPQGMRVLLRNVQPVMGK